MEGLESYEKTKGRRPITLPKHDSIGHSMIHATAISKTGHYLYLYESYNPFKRISASFSPRTVSFSVTQLKENTDTITKVTEVLPKGLFLPIYRRALRTLQIYHKTRYILTK